MIHFNICFTILLQYCYTFWGTKISAMDCFFRCYFDSLPLQLPRENGFPLFCVTEKFQDIVAIEAEVDQEVTQKVIEQFIGRTSYIHKR